MNPTDILARLDLVRDLNTYAHQSKSQAGPFRMMDMEDRRALGRIAAKTRDDVVKELLENNPGT